MSDHENMSSLCMTLCALCMCVGAWKWGACVSKSLYPQLSTTPPTRGPPVEAECVVDDRVFAGISEPHIPEKGRRTDGERHRRWRWFLRKNTGRIKATGNHFPRIWLVR